MKIAVTPLVLTPSLSELREHGVRRVPGPRAVGARRARRAGGGRGLVVLFFWRELFPNVRYWRGA